MSVDPQAAPSHDPAPHDPGPHDRGSHDSDVAAAQPAGWLLTARPQRTALIANVAAAAALVAFLAVAALMKRDNAGAVFGYKDQLFTVVVGLIVAGGLRLPARPRLRADAEAVYSRSYLGDYRKIPWAAVTSVEFPRKSRFARLVLPGDELLALYAVQRMDRDYAVDTMRGLRRLFAESHPDGR